MKAAVLREIGAPLEIADVPTPTLGPDEALVRVHSCGVCRTDVHIQDGMAYVPSLPHVPGHEPAGVVAELGADVSGVSVGDRVVPHLFLTCGHCWYCRTGRDAQCSHVGGILGVTCAGGFAEYFKAPVRNLLPLPESVGFDVGGLTSCAVVTAVHAFRRARLTAGDTAVVIGAGGIGQILIQLLHGAGMTAVAVSRSPESLAIAKKCGADETIEFADSHAAERLSSLTDGLGATCVFECVGTTASMDLACKLVMRCGQVVVIGEEPESPGIDTITIAQREIEIIGSRNGSRQDAADALRLMARGLVAPPIFETFALDEVNRALDLVRNGGAHGRTVVRLD